MNQNPTDEDITEAISESVGQAPARFVYLEGSEERGDQQNDSVDSLGIYTRGRIRLEREYVRNPELDRIDDRIRDWARQNLEEMKRPL